MTNEDEGRSAPHLLAQGPVVDIRVTRYAASCLPQDDVNADLFTLSIEERATGRWAVLRGGFCYDAEGNREYESIPSERADEFKARFRHSLEDALEIARKVAPTMTVNGHTVADALARGKQS